MFPAGELKYYNDVKVKDRWGYLLLTELEYVKQFQAVGFSLCKNLDYYWAPLNLSRPIKKEK